MKTSDSGRKKKHRVLKTLLVVIGGIFAVWFLLPVMTGIRPNVGTFVGFGFFGLLTLYGLFFDQANRFFAKLWKSIPGRIAEIVVAAFLAVSILTALVTLGCILSAAGQAPRPGSDVIVLGCKVNGTSPSLTLKKRMETALAYLEENPDVLCVVSGGQGAGEIVTEASVMKEWLIGKGIAEDRILAEEVARDTAENISLSVQMLEMENGAVGDVVIVTSDFHMYRALLIAREQGLEATGASAPTLWWLYPTYVVREMFGILESWFLM